MDTELIAIVNLSLTVAIAVATIWIAKTANRISKLQLSMDLERQKLEWCRACLQFVSQAVTLASYSEAEIEAVEFEKKRRNLRGEIIAYKNEGELFLMKTGQAPKDVSSLRALRKCYKAMNGDSFRAPTKHSCPNSNRVKDDIIVALKEFREAMRKGFGNKWSMAE